DTTRSRYGYCDERRRQVADASRHLESGSVQGLGEPGGGPLLLEPELRMRVDTVAQRHQIVAHRREAFPGASLRIHRSGLPAEQEVVAARLPGAVRTPDEDVGRDAPEGVDHVGV